MTTYRSAFYVAQRFGVSRSTVYRLAKRRQLTYTRIDGLIRFTDEAIAEYERRHTKLARTH